MIQINLSEEQARLMLDAFGWRDGLGEKSKIRLNEEVAAEVFRQLEHAFDPAGTEQAETAAWFGENGYHARQIEEWKRNNGKEVDTSELRIPMDVIRKHQLPYYPSFEVIITIGG
jgi:hypothetical protein